jgi:SAM-dependent methyltransferase
MPALSPSRLPWPLPALLGWASAWFVFALASQAAAPAGLAWTAGLAAGASAALVVRGPWRRALVAGGFPLSALALGAVGAMPAWAWLLPLALLMGAYPLRAWRDAPIFPTPAGALDALPGAVTLAPGARVLDAGCGAGDGLCALRRAWPEARLEGVEWSWPLAALARLRCRGARITRGDLWRGSWAGHDLVYLFQRPESMPRALAKARAEMAAGWLVSLEFEVAGATPWAALRTRDGRPLWVYRIGRPPAASMKGAVRR